MLVNSCIRASEAGVKKCYYFWNPELLSILILFLRIPHDAEECIISLQKSLGYDISSS